MPSRCFECSQYPTPEKPLAIRCLLGCGGEEMHDACWPQHKASHAPGYPEPAEEQDAEA